MSSAKGISPDVWLDSSRGRWTKAPHPAGLKIVFPSLRTVDASVLGRPVCQLSIQIVPATDVFCDRVVERFSATESNGVRLRFQRRISWTAILSEGTF
jgi:hypothetical protein